MRSPTVGSCPPSGRSRAGRSPLRGSADIRGSACCRSRLPGKRAACCSADRGRSVQGTCDLLSVLAGARTLVPRPGGLRRRRLAAALLPAALDGSMAAIESGRRLLVVLPLAELLQDASFSHCFLNRRMALSIGSFSLTRTHAMPSTPPLGETEGFDLGAPRETQKRHRSTAAP